MEGDSTALAILGGSILASVVVVIVLYVLLAIALWKIFAKFGEKGWKGWIPIYNLYIQFKYTWSTGAFWAMFILGILGGIFVGLSGDSQGALFYIGSICALAEVVILWVAEYKLYKAFGHGAGWLILSIFFPNIMTLVLGFGSSQYIGNQQ